MRLSCSLGLQQLHYRMGLNLCKPEHHSSLALLLLRTLQASGAVAPRQLGRNLKPLSPALLQWLQDRGISKATVDQNQVQMEQRYCGALKAFTDHIAFPYYKDGVVVNVKYRAPPKYFTQVKGGEQIFYGYDDAQVWGLVFVCLSCLLICCGLHGATTHAGLYACARCCLQ